MSLAEHRPAYAIPTYSLTADVLSFRRCGLQYRYYNRSALPPSRPVQMWTGEFLHAVLEDAYRLWAPTQSPSFPWPSPSRPDDLVDLDRDPPPEWPEYHVGRLGLRVELRLKAAGRTPRNKQARYNAYRRAAETINVLGPDMFPLVTTAEERITGTREYKLPVGSPRNTDRYELTGIVDVISSVKLRSHTNNRFVDAIRDALVDSDLDDEFDVIVDYKGMRRPSRPPAGSKDTDADRLWTDHSWQIQTYAHLRSRRNDRARVACGVILYLNELFPSRQDLLQLREDLRSGMSDVLPQAGTADYYAILGVEGRVDDDEDDDGPLTNPISLEMRLRRAIRVIPVTEMSKAEAVARIHEIVQDIEAKVAAEHQSGDIPTVWPATGERRDCVACDFRHNCPNPRTLAPGASRAPVAPG